MCCAWAAPGAILAVRPRGPEAERRVRRVVEGVDDVVRRAGVVGIRLEHLLGERAGAHVGRHVAGALAQAQERQRVERLGFEIVGIARRQPAHGRGVERVAPGLAAVAVQNLHRVEVPPLARRRARARRCSRARRQPRERCARRVDDPAGPRPGGSRSSPRPSRPERSSGSSRSASRNAAAASEYSKLCSSSTPRMNGFWAAFAPELGKEIVPSRLDCPASGAVDASTRTNAGHIVMRRVMHNDIRRARTPREPRKDSTGSISDLTPTPWHRQGRGLSPEGRGQTPGAAILQELL